MYCNEVAKVADGYKDSDESRSREYKREKSVVMKLVDKNSLLSPPKSLKSRTIQQPKLFKFELHGDKTNALSLEAVISDGVNSEQLLDCLIF